MGGSGTGAWEGGVGVWVGAERQFIAVSNFCYPFEVTKVLSFVLVFFHNNISPIHIPAIPLPTFTIRTQSIINTGRPFRRRAGPL